MLLIGLNADKLKGKWNKVPENGKISHVVLFFRLVFFNMNKFFSVLRIFQFFSSYLFISDLRKSLFLLYILFPRIFFLVIFSQRPGWMGYDL